jgi:hypothetical protein
VVLHSSRFFLLKACQQWNIGVQAYRILCELKCRVRSRVTQATDGETAEEARRKVLKRLITVAARSEAWNVFTRSNAGVCGFESHSRHGCLRLFCVCIGSGLATGWTPVQGVSLIVLD